MQALEQVFGRAAPELLRLALHLCRGLDRAEDLVQATFLAALEGAESFVKPPGSAGTTRARRIQSGSPRERSLTRPGSARTRR